MSDLRPTAELLDAWQGGDQSAASTLFDRYLVRLLALARARLGPSFRGRIDADDVVQSAYRSFFLGAREGRFRVGPDDDLWPLLATLTLRKLRRQVRYHSAELRSVEHEAVLPEPLDRAVLARDPAPEVVALVNEELLALLRPLEPVTREIGVRLLRGESTAEIGQALSLSERTVRRVAAELRETLERQGGTPLFPCPPAAVGYAQDISEEPVPPLSLQAVLLQQMVGQGAFSKVYRAVLQATGTPVAVKFLRKALWHDSRAAASLKREFTILNDLRHPHILHVEGWGTTPRGALFLVAEWIEGVALTARRMTPVESLPVLRDVAAALDAAHDAGLVHGDLKPQNVLRRNDGRCVLIDFGMARRFEWEEDHPRGGTAGFLAPEQISPAFGAITPRTDVYGWGALAYALLTGRPPFCGADLPETIAQILASHAPVALRELAPDVSVTIAELIHCCLMNESANRPVTMAVVRAALKSILQETARAV